MTVSFQRVIPVLRAFHAGRAQEFYLDYLGFSLDWEHKRPLLMQVSRETLVLRLSEGHQPGLPTGAAVMVQMNGIHELHAELEAKNGRHRSPTLTTDKAGAWLRVIDPFGNQLVFNQPTDRR